MFRICIAVAAMGLTLAVAASANAQKHGDVRGSRDHAAVGARYPGSKIVRYSTRKFDSFNLLVGPVKHGGKPGKHEKLEGRITRASYEIARGHSTLQVFRNYEILLKKKGFKPLYSCTNRACGGRGFNLTVVPYWSGFSANYGDQRYAAMRAKGRSADVYVAVYVVRNASEGGPRHNRIFAQVDVVEVARMDVGMEVVDAAKMRREIDRHGHIALYGILFDTNSATIREKSHAMLAEIARLLKSRPGLKLLVVGHTDNQGSLDYNLKLSGRRSQSVVQFLTARHGITPGRLKAHGLGFLAPVATNRSPEGRQKNRRVVLVEH